jgi:DNA-binding NarL/FixJ family response regulator
MLLVGEAANGFEAMERFPELRPDVTLMGLRLPDSSGIGTTIAIRAHFPRARIILVSTFDGDIDLRDALQAGAWGHIVKTMHPREMVDRIRQVHAGAKNAPFPATDLSADDRSDEALSPREVEVLARVAGGNRIRDIVDRLVISENTVNNDLKQITQKPGARDRTNALTIAARRGFIRL